MIDVSICGHKMDSLDIFCWSKNIDNAFWEKYYLLLLLYPDYVRPYVSCVTKALKDNGHNIFIISARKNADLPKIEKRTMYNITHEYLINNNIYYNELILEENKWNVIDMCHINMMIEDNPLFFMHHTKNPTIPLLCFDTPYNQDVCGTNISRVYSWHDILIKTKKIQEDFYEYQKTSEKCCSNLRPR